MSKIFQEAITMNDAKKRSDAAKKAWVTRRKNKGTRLYIKIKLKPEYSDPEAAKKIFAKAQETRRKNKEQAEAERLEALCILEEMGKNDNK